MKTGCGGCRAEMNRRGTWPANVTAPFDALESDNFQSVAITEARERGVWFALVPVGHRGDIVLERQVAPALAPAQRLDRHAQIVLEADGVAA